MIMMLPLIGDLHGLEPVRTGGDASPVATRGLWQSPDKPSKQAIDTYEAEPGGPSSVRGGVCFLVTMGCSRKMFTLGGSLSHYISLHPATKQPRKIDVIGWIFGQECLNLKQPDVLDTTGPTHRSGRKVSSTSATSALGGSSMSRFAMVGTVQNHSGQ